jgi:acyl carrier protein
MNHITQTDDDISFMVKDMMMSKFGLEESQLPETANIHDDLGIDSLDIYEFLIEMEKKFHITIMDEEGEKLRTVGNIIQLVKNKKFKL